MGLQKPTLSNPLLKTFPVRPPLVTFTLSPIIRIPSKAPNLRSFLRSHTVVSELSISSVLWLPSTSSQILRLLLCYPDSQQVIEDSPSILILFFKCFLTVCSKRNLVLRGTLCILNLSLVVVIYLGPERELVSLPTPLHAAFRPFSPPLNSEPPCNCHLLTSSHSSSFPKGTQVHCYSFTLVLILSNFSTLVADNSIPWATPLVRVLDHTLQIGTPS